MADAVTADLLLGGRYRLLREVARGGMATIWEAEDSVLGRRVAVKVLHPHLAADDSLRERFRREAVAVARLTHHSIVSIFDTGDEDDLAYLVMELVDGVSMRDLLLDRGPLDHGLAVDIITQVADGLAAAHQRGIVHRDVKPGNILVRSDGRAKLTDFGIARGEAGTELDQDLTQTGTVLGTAKYLAPEQVEGKPVDARADVYALGLVLYEAVCGRPAFEGDSELATAVARTQRPPLSPRQLRVDIPRPLEDVIMTALTLDPEGRYPSAAEFRTALRGLDVPPAPATAAAPAVPLAPPDDRRFTAGVLAVVAIAAIVAAAGLILAGTEAGRSVIERVREGLPGGQRDPTPVSIAGISDLDPFGDGAEHPEDVGLAHDGNPATAWTTSRYSAPQQEFGGLKDGLGLRIDLANEQELRELRVRSPDRGWSAEIYVGSGPSSGPQGWGEAVARRADLGRDETFDLDGATGQSVLLWITRLPASGQLQIAEVDVST